MKKRLLYIVPLLVLAVAVVVAWAGRIHELPYGVASPKWYGFSSGAVSTYYLEHPTLTANDQVVVEGVAQTLTKKIIKETVSNAGATATVTLTASDASGIFSNDSQATRYALPADPTGLTFNFVVGSANNLTVDPNGSDQIVLKTANTGYYYQANALGETLILKGISTSQWAVMSELGSWSDSGQEWGG